MADDKSFDLAISVDSTLLVDEFFHISTPTQSNLQTSISVTSPNRQFEIDRENSRLRLRAIVGVRFLMFDGAAPAEITQDDIDRAVISYGCAVETTVSSAFMSDAIPQGKHAQWTGEDIESARDKQMEHNMLLEAVRLVYGMASARMLQSTAICPFGAVSLPLADYDALLKDIEEQN